MENRRPYEGQTLGGVLGHGLAQKGGKAIGIVVPPGPVKIIHPSRTRGLDRNPGTFKEITYQTRLNYIFING